MNKYALWVGLALVLVGCGGSSGAGLSSPAPAAISDAQAEVREAAPVTVGDDAGDAGDAPDAQAEVREAAPVTVGDDAGDAPDAQAEAGPSNDPKPPVAVTCITSAGPRTCNPALQQVSIVFFLPFGDAGAAAPTWCNPDTGTGTSASCPHGTACTAYEGASSWSGTCL